VLGQVGARWAANLKTNSPLRLYSLPQARRSMTLMSLTPLAIPFLVSYFLLLAILSFASCPLPRVCRCGTSPSSLHCVTHSFHLGCFTSLRASYSRLA